MNRLFLTAAVLVTAVLTNSPGFNSKSKYYGLQGEDGQVHFENMKNFAKNDDGLIGKAFDLEQSLEDLGQSLTTGYK
jgi:hypothetical protein